jgi:phosphoribosyl-ATP pyrophosphohydrolase/phosphoribosyl-AMP cyclohydrolase
MSIEVSKVDWKKLGGLLPVIVQDEKTLQVLMQAYMNEDALIQTLETGRVTFYSRTKERLWTKGESSGNFLELCTATMDCDDDALLITARPAGPTCHRETTSCFGEAKAPGVGFLSQLEKVIEKRFEQRPEGSYTTKMINSGLDRMAQKVGEEGVEVVIAAKNSDLEAFKGEAADLIFHLLLLLKAKSVSLDEVIDVLRARHRG